jgi:hypothetical protein
VVPRTDLDAVEKRKNLLLLEIEPRMSSPLLYRLIYSGFTVNRPEPNSELRRGVDKSLAFPASSFPICGTTKRIFLRWVKEVRTTKS